MIAFMVAGTASGVGKTTAALALMAALQERGYRVQPFKCGPDFLDTGHHTAICGRVSRNLDTWMLDGEANRAVFTSASRDADAAIVEGMMGLYDGVAGGTEEGSAAEIAKLLGLPSCWCWTPRRVRAALRQWSRASRASIQRCASPELC